MAEARPPSLHRRGATWLLTEGLVIVGSILLAFAIEASWQKRSERVRAEQLVTSLRADLEATRDAIEFRQAWARDIVAGARAILEGISSGVTGADLDSLVFDVGNVFVKGRWVPINHTYEQALGAGDLALIEDGSIRFLLGQYSETLANFSRMQDNVVTQYYGQLEPFMVANVDYAQVAWEEEAGGLVRGPFSTDSRALAAEREFSNLLNLKLELELEVIDSLAGLLELSDEVLERLGP